MAESAVTFKVWIALLAACRENGVAYVSAVYLSSICHLPLSRVEDSLKKLESPDEHSRSIADEGRRVRRIDGGYEIINYTVYRDFSLRDAEAERKRLYRQRLKECPDNVPDRPDSSASASVSASASEIIKYLNEKAGRHYRPDSASVRDMIVPRLKEGRTVEEFKRIIDLKVAKWGGDPKMDDFLRPSTLFRKSHFDEYLNERPPIKGGDGKPSQAGDNADPRYKESYDRRKAKEEL